MRGVVANFIRDIQPIKPLLVGARALNGTWFAAAVWSSTLHDRGAPTAPRPRPSTGMGGPAKCRGYS